MTKVLFFSSSSFSSITLIMSTTTQTISTFEEEVSPGRVLTMPTDGTGLSVLDPWLSPFDDYLRERYA